MTKLGDGTLELRPIQRPEYAQEDNLRYDPHLQEETIRLWAGQPPSPVACTKADRLDVIAKIGSDQSIPQEIEDRSIVGIVGNGQAGAQGKNGKRKKLANGQYQIVTGTIQRGDVQKVHDKVTSLKASLPVHLHLFNSIPVIRCDLKSLDTAACENGTKYSGLNGSDVIIGIVDSGCDFRHRSFRQPDGETRLLYLWDQSKEKPDAPPPQPFNYGREFTADRINQALTAGDENAYTVLDYTPPIAAHGTHVMDIAAGNGREPDLFDGKPGILPSQPSTPGVAPHAQIIFVNLRSSEKQFLGSSRGVLDGVTYIFQKADALGKPAVVNLSLSTTGGPHDGTTLVEQGFEALVTAKPGRAIVTSAGNAFTMQSHVSGRVTQGDRGRAKIQWQTDPRHTGAVNGPKNEIEIWYPGGKTLNVTLYAPGSKTPVGSVPLGDTQGLFIGETRVGRISHRQGDPNNGDNHVDIRLPHLEDVPQPPQPRLPWTIELSSEADSVPFHAWIEQSERGLSRFAGKVDPTVTLGSISCGNGTLTVGAFDTSEKAALTPLFPATSAGPIRETDANAEKGLRPKPELSAPGVNVVAARAQGGVNALSGTSMAAPHVTGLIALLFQLAHVSGRGLIPFSKVCDILTQGVQPLPAGKLPNPKPKKGDKPHDLQLGYGRIDGPSSVRALLDTVLLSFSLDLKLNEKDIRKFVDSTPDFNALLTFLKTHTQLNDSNTLKVSDFVSFFKDQVGKNEFFRITMESLGDRKS